MTAGFGDKGPEAVYCFHMEPTCGSHLPGDYFFLCFTVICTFRVLLPLGHDHTAFTALLSFVSKTNSETMK